jgi:replicative DNA helicase
MPSLDKVLLNRARGLRDDCARASAGEKLITHVPTGFRAIDDEFGGIRIGCATELMAHTGDGKSAFARQIAESAAKAGAGVLWFCGEDPEDATAERQLSDGTGIPATEMGRLDLTAGELDRIEQAAREAEGWAQRIDVRFGPVDVDDLVRAVDEALVTGINGAPLRLVIVDYLQIMAAARNLEDDIARLSTAMNARAGGVQPDGSVDRDARLAVLLLSQVASDVLKRGRDYYKDHRDVSGFCPGLGDTEWCRRAEKSVKAVWALYRPGRWQREMGEDAKDDNAQLHVRKANFGGMGWAPLTWDGPGCRFGNED